MHIFMDSFSTLWYSDELSDFQRIKVIEALKGEVFLLDFLDDLNGHLLVLELP